MSVVSVLALKQTQAVDPQIKAETQAEVSTDNPQPVSIVAVQQGVTVYASIPSYTGFEFGRRLEAFCFTGTDYTLGLSVCVVSPVVTALN